LFSQTIPKHPIFVGVALMDNKQEFNKFVDSLAPDIVIKCSDDLNQLTSIQQARIQTWMKKNNYNLTESKFDNDVNESHTSRSVTKTINHDMRQLSLGIDIQSTQAFACLQADKREHLRSYGCFSDAEISHCLSKINCEETAAGIFALKEAVVKAEHGAVNISDIAVSYSHGAPNVHNYACSISHDSGFAIAVALKNNISNMYNSTSVEKDDLAQSTVPRVNNITFMKATLLSVMISFSMILIYEAVLKNVFPF